MEVSLAVENQFLHSEVARLKKELAKFGWPVPLCKCGREAYHHYERPWRICLHCFEEQEYGPDSPLSMIELMEEQEEQEQQKQQELELKERESAANKDTEGQIW